MPSRIACPRLPHTVRAERIGFARPAKRRLRLLIRLQQRLVGPVRRERRVRVDRVHARKDLPGAIGGDSEPLFHVLHRRVHRCLLSVPTGRPSAANGPSSHRTTRESVRTVLSNFRRVFARPCPLSGSGPGGPVSGQKARVNGHIRQKLSPLRRARCGTEDVVSRDIDAASDPHLLTLVAWCPATASRPSPPRCAGAVALINANVVDNIERHRSARRRQSSCAAAGSNRSAPAPHRRRADARCSRPLRGARPHRRARAHLRTFASLADGARERRHHGAQRGRVELCRRRDA